MAAAAAAATEASGQRAWQQLFSRIDDQTPLCKRHGEKCHLRTVKKAGPTKGRQSYTCPRAEGPKDNFDSNCDFFMWHSDRVKEIKAATRKAQ